MVNYISHHKFPNFLRSFAEFNLTYFQPSDADQIISFTNTGYLDINDADKHIQKNKPSVLVILISSFK